MEGLEGNIPKIRGPSVKLTSKKVISGQNEMQLRCPLPLVHRPAVIFST